MFRRNKDRSTFRKQNSDAASVVQELREKMSRLKFRLLDCQNQNQMLRKELLQAKKVVNKEISPMKASFKDVLNQGTNVNYRGRREKIMLLKDKLNELQNRIKQLEDSGAEKSPEDSVDAPRKDDQQKCKFFRCKQMVNKELQYLLENSCQLKRKLEIWKKRSTEEGKEIEILRLELEKLVEKSQEDSHVHQSYHSVEKELRSRQKEKLDIRSKLDGEKTRNEQLVGEIADLKENISLILSNMNDDKVLIDALKNQQGNLHDLLERQKLISESDNRRFSNDLREIQAKHTTNDNTLSHLHDVVKEKNDLCLQLQEYLKQKEHKDDFESSEKPESTTSSLKNDSEPSQQSVPQQQQLSPASDATNEMNEERVAPDAEEIALAEECEQHKNVLQSMDEEVNQLRNVVLTNDKRLDDWMVQLLQSKSLLSKKNAEVRDLEEILKLLQKSCEKKRSPSPQPSSIALEEMQKRSDVLTEEFQCLLGVWELLLFNEETSVEIYIMSVDTSKWLFVEDVYNLTVPEDDIQNAEEQPVQAEDEEKSENA